MHVRTVFGSLLSLYACSPTHGSLNELATIPNNAYAAIVSSDQAFFAFPAETLEYFDWPANSLDPANDRYSWSIAVSASDTSFFVVAEAYRPTHPAPFSSLADALGAAAPALDYNAGGLITMRDDRARIGVRLSERRVILTLRGAVQVGRLFRARPKTVHFGLFGPRGPLRQEVVAVQYKAFENSAL